PFPSGFPRMVGKSLPVRSDSFLKAARRLAKLNAPRSANFCKRSMTTTMSTACGQHSNKSEIQNPNPETNLKFRTWDRHHRQGSYTNTFSPYWFFAITAATCLKD